jgi:hypothetical protein
MHLGNALIDDLSDVSKRVARQMQFRYSLQSLKPGCAKPGRLLWILACFSFVSFGRHWGLSPVLSLPLRPYMTVAFFIAPKLGLNRFRTVSSRDIACRHTEVLVLGLRPMFSLGILILHF